MIDSLIGLPDWHLDAACRGMNPDLFFPERGGSARRAKAVCASCPVQADCLEWALDIGARFGIWGGLSEKARRRVRADRRVA